MSCLENKRNKNYIITMISIACVLLIISLLLLVSEYKIYIILSFLLLIIDLILLIVYLMNTRTDHDIYQKNIKYILKTFDSILAYMDDSIDLRKKEVIKLNTFEDIVNCREELKKPIFYNYNDTSAVFLIIDNNTIIFTTMKEEGKEEHPFAIKLMNKMTNKYQSCDDVMLENVEKTMFIHVKDNKILRISPINKEKMKEELENKKLEEAKEKKEIDNLFNEYNKSVEISNEKISKDDEIEIL